MGRRRGAQPNGAGADQSWPHTRTGTDAGRGAFQWSAVPASLPVADDPYESAVQCNGPTALPRPSIDQSHGNALQILHCQTSRFAVGIQLFVYLNNSIGFYDTLHLIHSDEMPPHIDRVLNWGYTIVDYWKVHVKYRHKNVKKKKLKKNRSIELSFQHSK